MPFKLPRSAIPKFRQGGIGDDGSSALSEERIRTAKVVGGAVGAVVGGIGEALSAKAKENKAKLTKGQTRAGAVVMGKLISQMEQETKDVGPDTLGSAEATQQFQAEMADRYNAELERVGDGIEDPDAKQEFLDRGRNALADIQVGMHKTLLEKQSQFLDEVEEISLEADVNSSTGFEDGKKKYDAWLSNNEDKTPEEKENVRKRYLFSGLDVEANEKPEETRASLDSGQYKTLMPPEVEQQFRQELTNRIKRNNQKTLDAVLSTLEPADDEWDVLGPTLLSKLDALDKARARIEDPSVAEDNGPAWQAKSMQQLDFAQQQVTQFYNEAMDTQEALADPSSLAEPGSVFRPSPGILNQVIINDPERIAVLSSGDPVSIEAMMYNDLQKTKGVMPAVYENIENAWWSAGAEGDLESALRAARISALARQRQSEGVKARSNNPWAAIGPNGAIRARGKNKDSVELDAAKAAFLANPTAATYLAVTDPDPVIADKVEDIRKDATLSLIEQFEKDEDIVSMNLSTREREALGNLFLTHQSLLPFANYEHLKNSVVSEFNSTHEDQPVGRERRSFNLPHTVINDGRTKEEVYDDMFYVAQKKFGVEIDRDRVDIDFLGYKNNTEWWGISQSVDDDLAALPIEANRIPTDVDAKGNKVPRDSGLRDPRFVTITSDDLRSDDLPSKSRAKRKRLFVERDRLKMRAKTQTDRYIRLNSAREINRLSIAIEEEEKRLEFMEQFRSKTTGEKMGFGGPGPIDFYEEELYFKEMARMAGAAAEDVYEFVAGERITEKQKRAIVKSLIPNIGSIPESVDRAVKKIDKFGEPINMNSVKDMIFGAMNKLGL